MTDVKDILKDEIPIRDVVERLGLDLRVYGNSLQGDCPTGHPSEGHKCFSVNLGGNFYHCFHCHTGGDVISLVELVKGVDFREALKWLTTEFRRDLLPQIDGYKGEQDPGLREYYQKASFYDLIYQHGKTLLYEAQGKEALNYLTTVRGYKAENLKQTEWIYYPPDKELRAYLRKERPESRKAIDELKLHGYFGDNFRLAFPYRDRRGTITGFVFRSTAPKGIMVSTYDGKPHTEVRWDSITGTKKDDLFNLCKCKGHDELVIVEGYPDAMYLPTLGLKNVVAVGQGLLSKSHIPGLQAFKVKRVIFSLDNDPKQDGTFEGAENTETAINLLKGTGIRAFVIDPPLLSPHKDPDEFVGAKGIGAFKALVDNAQAGSKWLVNRWATQHNLTRALTKTRDLDKERFIKKALEWDASIPEAEARDGEDFLKTAAQVAGYDLDSLLAERTGIQERKARERQEKAYRDLARDIERHLAEGKIEDIARVLDERYKTLKGARAIIRDPFYQYESLQRDLSSTIPGLSTGFEALDKFIRIPQEALTIVAARPSHGKTTFLMNLQINLIEKYPGKHFFFFSYEETRKKLAVKLINILAGVVVAEDRMGFNVGQIENYIRGNNQGIPPLNEGIERYNSLVASQRLGLIAEHFFIDDLTDYIAHLTEKYDTGAVLIDYIQKVKSKRAYQSRQLEIQDISRQLLETSLACSVPIVLGAQASRQATDIEGLTLDTLREAGDIEQDANLVLGLWNKTQKKEDSERDRPAIYGVTSPSDRVVDLDVVVMKNRDGVTNQKATLSFDRPVLKLKDKTQAY